MLFKQEQLEIREFLKKLQGKNAIDVIVKSLDYAETQLEKAIIDIDIYSVNFINRGGSSRILFREISFLKANETEVSIFLKNFTFIKFTLI